MATADFSRLARVYRALEFVAFGRDLERTRFCLLDRLRDRRAVLIFGEGDGRCLARLAQLAPTARFRCVDGSAGMIAAARKRLRESDRGRVEFICGDAREVDLGGETYDAVVTLFFLDCLTTGQVERLIARTAPHLAPGARWLFADFVTPPRGWRKVRARLWLATLYTFFRWQTRLSVRALPDSERVLEQAGFVPGQSRTFQHGMLRATLYQMPAPRAPAAGPL
jgi:ubiquinone/menaquinone biosynthesis C-methylase UbiE